MKSIPKHPRLHVAVLVSILAVPLPVLGQSAAPSGPPASPPDQSPPPSLQPAPSPSASGNQIVTLDPFSVTETSSNSYAAMNSNSLTAFSVPLERLPETADIMDRTFLDDVGALDLESAIAAYDAGASWSPQDNGSAVSTAQWGHNQPGDTSGNNPTIFLRGFPVEGILTDGQQLNFGNEGQTGFESTSNFDLDRIEIIDGPQALMYSGSGVGGAVNVVTKQAYFGQPASGDFSMRFDEYGTKYATFDYGVSEGNLAACIALVDGTTQNRRVNNDDSLQGAYVQLAAELGNTTFRLSLQQSVDNLLDTEYLTLTSTGDPQYSQFTGDHLEYLLAANLAPGILNGGLNWNNVESLVSNTGDWSSPAESAILQADSTWTKWLSTKLQVGGANLLVDRGTGSTFGLYSPGASANPLPGNWTETASGLGDGVTVHKNNSMTGTALITNELFGGSAKSQTSIEGDYERNVDVNVESFAYYEADSNWNVIVTPGVSTNFGRTPFPTISWSVNNGPRLYTQPNIAYGTQSGQRLTYNGVNYVREQNALFEPNAAGFNWTYEKYFDAGYSLINDTEWLNGKLDSLIGARFDRVVVLEPNSANYDEMRKPDFSAGVVYHLWPWLSPYLNVSDIWEPKLNEQNVAEVTGDNGDESAYSLEAGFKVTDDDNKISGSISAYRSYAHNDVVAPNAIAAGDIDPDGLNGVYGTASSPTNMDVTTYGVTANLTATPTPNWRMRLSAAWTGGTYTGGATAPQYYNDQFFENSAGDVTYADGSVVYVPATFNKSQLTVPSTTAGAVPLTVTLLSTPSSQYYASPAAITGAISKTSNGGLVLLNGSTSPAGTTGHGSILTNAVGLPMTAYQLNTALTGIVPAGGFVLNVPDEQSFGYPVWSFNFTSIYQFPSGWLKGFEIGGTASVNWKFFLYDWYSSSSNLSPSSLHTFYNPTMPSFNLIAGYTHKFGRYAWSVQLNVNNMFNTYQVLEYPYVLGGYSIANSNIANLDAQPRMYILTTKLQF